MPQTRRNKKNKKGQSRRNKGLRGRRIRERRIQNGGGVLFELIPSDLKQIGYFFENLMKSIYNGAFGMP